MDPEKGGPGPSEEQWDPESGDSPERERQAREGEGPDQHRDAIYDDVPDQAEEGGAAPRGDLVTQRPIG